MEPNRRKTDLSPEQGKLVRREVRGALRRYTIGAILGYMILLTSSVYLYNAQEQADIDRAKDASAHRARIVQSGNIVAVDGCNRDFRDRQTLRGLLQASKSAQLRSYLRGDITKSRYELGRDFFKEQLARLPLPDCREAQSVLTADPDAPLVSPQPLYPRKG